MMVWGFLDDVLVEIKVKVVVVKVDYYVVVMVDEIIVIGQWYL